MSLPTADLRLRRGAFFLARGWHHNALEEFRAALRIRRAQRADDPVGHAMTLLAIARAHADGRRGAPRLVGLPLRPLRDRGRPGPRPPRHGVRPGGDRALPRGPVAPRAGRAPAEAGAGDPRAARRVRRARVDRDGPAVRLGRPGVGPARPRRGDLRPGRSLALGPARARAPGGRPRRPGPGDDPPPRRSPLLGRGALPPGPGDLHRGRRPRRAPAGRGRVLARHPPGRPPPPRRGRVAPPPDGRRPARDPRRRPPRGGPRHVPPRLGPPQAPPPRRGRGPRPPGQAGAVESRAVEPGQSSKIVRPAPGSRQVRLGVDLVADVVEPRLGVRAIHRDRAESGLDDPDRGHARAR